MRAAVRSWAHSNSGNNTDSDKHGHNRTATITDERKRQTDDWQNPQTHSYIDTNLEKQHTADTDANQAIHKAVGTERNIETADNDRK